MTTKAIDANGAAPRHLTQYEGRHIPPEYKWTEAGVIPIDWRDSQIRDVCTLINGRGFKPHEWRTSGLPIIRIQNLNGSDVFNYYDGSFNPKILVPDGQLLFAWSGSRGTSFGPHIWHGSTGLLNYHTWKVVPNESNVDTSFLFHALRHLTAYIEAAAHGVSALVHTQKWEMETFHLAVPPPKEQHAIAEALSDVDGLLGALETLLAKKRSAKQAAVQQLLTGKTRLPGFGEQWTTRRLGDVTHIVSGATPSTRVAAYWNGEIPWCTPTDITSTRGKYLETTDRSITRDGLASCAATLLPPGALLLCTRATIGEVRIAGSWICTNQGFKALVCKQGTSNEFLYYLLLILKPQMLERAIGSTFLEIGKQDVASIEASFPLEEEQVAIATVLSDMDAEIAALEARRDKSRAIKLGMMQQLLTGRVRLVKPSPADKAA